MNQLNALNEFDLKSVLIGKKKPADLPMAKKSAEQEETNKESESPRVLRPWEAGYVDPKATKSKYS